MRTPAAPQPVLRHLVKTTLFSLPLTPYPATPTPGNTGILCPHKCIEKADDADERDTKVQGYTNSSTKKDAEDNDLVPYLMTAKENQSVRSTSMKSD